VGETDFLDDGFGEVISVVGDGVGVETLIKGVTSFGAWALIKSILIQTPSQRAKRPPKTISLIFKDLFIDFFAFFALLS